MYLRIIFWWVNSKLLLVLKKLQSVQKHATPGKILSQCVHIMGKSYQLPSLFYRGQHGSDKKGLGTIIPHDLKQGDDEFDAYRKRMMMAYRFRPNPLVRFDLLVMHIF